MYDLWKSLITEFLGTFLLVFIGAGATALSLANGGSVIGSAFAFGLTYLILIYTIGSYSGANYNPAISFGLAVSGRLGWCRMLLYWIVQILGAIAAAALLAWIYGFESGVGAPVGELTYSEPWKVLVLEIILTFFLVFTFLFMSRNPMVSLISGFVIGLALTADILVGGRMSIVALNPAYALATDMFSGNFSSFWMYVLGPLIGALLAALIYKAFTIPWSCAEIADKGCYNDACGQLPFQEEWKECDPMFIMKGKEIFDANKRQLEARGDMCTSPCDLPVKPKCVKTCIDPCEKPYSIPRQNYRYVPL